MFDQRIHGRPGNRDTVALLAAPAARFARAMTAAALAVLVSLAAAALSASPAAAQQVVVVVNGEPITSLDIDYRTRIVEAFTQRRPSRQEVIDLLIDDKIKLRQAQRLDITITDAMVDRSFAGMAQRSGRTAADFEAAFRQAGIDPRAFKARIRADLAWTEVMQRMYPTIFQVHEADIAAALIARGQDPTAKAIQYTLQQIVFVVPRGSPESVRAARMREAEALRNRFIDCESGVQLAREHPEVVVKDPVIRMSVDLPTRLQQLLAQTADGRLTPPEPIAAGFEVVAVCGRKETIADLSARREIREQLIARRVEAQEKQLLERLRRQAIIEYR